MAFVIADLNFQVLKQLLWIGLSPREMIFKLVLPQTKMLDCPCNFRPNISPFKVEANSAYERIGMTLLFVSCGF